MNVRALNLFSKFVLKRGESLFFTRKFQSYCELEKERVVINELSVQEKDDSFIDHIKNSHGFKAVNKYPHCIWTLLHEVGHLRTDEDVEDDIDTRNFCQFAYENNLLDYEQINNIYYDMPDEWAATEWAIDFVKKHRVLCKLFGKVIG